MKKNLTLILAFIVIGCSTHTTEQSQPMHQIVDFAKNYTLQNAEIIDWDIMGIQDFLICDSLFIYSKRDRRGCVGILNKQGRKQGDFISIGNGPNEFLFAPWINRAMVYRADNCLYMELLDQMKGINYKMNITESISKGKTVMEKEKDSIPPASIFIPIDKRTSFSCLHNAEKTQRTRVITTDGNIKHNPYLDLLNNKSIDYGQDPNILSSIIKYSRERKRFVEISLMMNTIYLYDINGHFFKAMYVGETLDDEQKVQRQEMGQRRLTFTNLRLYDNFWAVIYIDETLARYDRGKCKPSRILLFDWDGEPLANLLLENKIDSFDIDCKDGYLYTLDNGQERLSRYLIKNIIDDIKL